MSARRIGLALGGGGARGLAHLHALAAFDELGVRPAAIAGASIGAIYGAAYAAGMSAEELKDHTARMLASRRAIVAKLLRSRVGRVTDLFGAGSRNPLLLDLEKLLSLMLPEALPGIVLGLTLAIVSLIGYSAMVGAVGGEGLGDLGIRYGYQRFMPDVMLAVVVILIVLVQAVQSLGEWIARRLDHRAAKDRGL